MLTPADSDRSDALASAVREAVCLRQPIVDAQRRVVGYELLVPGAPAGTDPAVSARLLLQAFTTLDFDLLAGARPAFVTVAPALLASLDLLPVAPDRVVLQVEAGGWHDGTVRAAIERHARLGYAFAVHGATGPEDLDAVPEARVARVDVSGLEGADVLARLAALRRDGVDLHAMGVADIAAFHACLDGGCTSFQGAFRTLPAPDLAGADLGALSVCGELLDPTAELEQLEAMVARDLALTYGLLRYVNSAFYARRTEVGSIRQACTVLGERMTRRWALVVTLGAAAAGGGDTELLGEALVRAKILEALAADLPGLQPETAFTVGLLSLLPGLVHAPMAEALGGLTLPAEVEAALVDGAPPYGALLCRTVAYLAGEGGHGTARLDAAYGSALRWVADVQPALARERQRG